MSIRNAVMLTPGPGLIEGARALGSPKRRLGVYPYQWQYPGPNARPVREEGAVDMPEEYGSPAVILQYRVPTGMRFSLRGIVTGSQSPDWNIGSGDLLFSLSIANSVGDRPVEGYNRMIFPLGNLQLPWPIVGRLEFESLETLVLSVTPVAGVTLGAEGGLNQGILVGFIYPNGEAGEG